jgi:predicted ArsR family transcriptional regulator
MQTNTVAYWDETVRERRRARGDARYKAIAALLASRAPLPDTELAAITAMEVEAVRETLTELADARLVEVTYQNNTMIGRLSAL